MALDEAREILRSHQIHNALINIGGNILALGNNGGSPWRIELRPATTQPSLGVIILKDGEAVATSGGGERRFIYQGKVYHHILDWRSGEPASSTAAAVVISDDAQNAGAISDAAATALVIANQREAARILQNFKISVALRLFNDGEKKTTAPMKSACNARREILAAIKRDAFQNHAYIRQAFLHRPSAWRYIRMRDKPPKTLCPFSPIMPFSSAPRKKTSLKDSSARKNGMFMRERQSAATVLV